MKKIFFPVMFSAVFCGAAAAQEYCFSQYYLDKLAVSPAFAAVGDYSEIGLIFRDQWPGIEGGFKIYNAEYQQKLPTFNCGLGLRLFGDMSGGGAFKTTEADLIYAYEFSLTHSLKCSFGIQAGYHTKKLDQSGLVYYSMIEGSTGSVAPINENVRYDKSGSVNFSGGMMLYTRQTLCAFGLYRITSLRVTGEKNLLPVTTTVLINHKIKVASKVRKDKIEDVFIAPTLNFAYSSSAVMIMPGAYFYGSKLLAGLALRYQKSDWSSAAVVMSAGFNFGRFEIGLGYDVYLSAIGPPSKNSVEAGVKYKFENSEKNSGSKTILCPAF